MPFSNERSPSAPIVYGDISLDPKDGSVTATQGNFDDVNIGGNSLTESLMDVENGPRGSILIYRLFGDMPMVNQTSIQLFSLNLTLADLRDIVLFTPTIRISTTNSPTSTGAGYAGLSIVCSSDTNPMANWQQDIFGLPFAGGNKVNQIQASFISLVKTHLKGDAKVNLRAVVSVRPGLGPWKIVNSLGDRDFMIVDMGSNVGRTFLDYNLSTIQNDAPDPEPTPTPTKYVGNFYTSHYATYSLNSGDNQTSKYPGLIRQSTAGTPRIGMVSFNGKDQYGRTLSNLSQSHVKVTDVKVYIGKEHDGKSVRWYYSAGGIGRLYWHGHRGAFPAEGIPSRSYLGDITNWKNNQERSYSLNGLLSRFANNTFGGIALSGEGKFNQYTYHGDFPQRVRLQVSYTVTG